MARKAREVILSEKERANLEKRGKNLGSGLHI